MCREIIKPVLVSGRRVVCAGKTYYLPRNAPARLSQRIQSAVYSNKMLDVELLQHYLIVRAYSDK